MASFRASPLSVQSLPSNYEDAASSFDNSPSDKRENSFSSSIRHQFIASKDAIRNTPSACISIEQAYIFRNFEISIRCHRFQRQSYAICWANSSPKSSLFCIASFFFHSLFVRSLAAVAAVIPAVLLLIVFLLCIPLWFDALSYGDGIRCSFNR